MICSYKYQASLYRAILSLFVPQLHFLIYLLLLNHHLSDLYYFILYIFFNSLHPTSFFTMKVISVLFMALAIIACVSVADAHRGRHGGRPGRGAGRGPRFTPEPGVPFCKFPYTLDESASPVVCTLSRELFYPSRAATCNADGTECTCRERSMLVEGTTRCCRGRGNYTYTIERKERGSRVIEEACVLAPTAVPMCPEGETFDGESCE